MSESLVLSETHAGVRTLVFNRPARKNAFTPAMYTEVVEGLRAASADPKVRVVLLAGAGDAFTSGNDLSDFAETPPAGTESPVFHLLTALVDFDKPLVAAVHGPAIGIGTTMLLHCDLVYAADSAKFRMPFVNLGLCPEGASSLLLPQVAGFAKASELLLFGDFFDGATAKEAGIVNAVLPAAELRKFALEKCVALAQRPAASLRLTKKLLRGTVREQVHAALLREGNEFLQRLTSPEAAEAFGAFFEKRVPDFSQFD